MRSVHGRCDVSCCSLSFSKTILTMYCKLVHGNLPSNYPIIDLPCSDSLSFTCPFLHSHVSSSAEVHVPNRPSRTVHGASRGAQRPNRESGRRRPGQMLTTSISKRISASENSSFPSNFTNRFNKEFRVPPRFRTERFSHRVFEPADFASWFFRHDRTWAPTSLFREENMALVFCGRT